MRYAANDKKISKMHFKEPNILLRDSALFVELPLIPAKEACEIRDIFERAGLGYEIDSESVKGYHRFRIDFMDTKSESIVAATEGIKGLPKQNKRRFKRLAGGSEGNPNDPPPRLRAFKLLRDDDDQITR